LIKSPTLKTAQKIKQNLDMNLKALDNQEQRNRGTRKFSDGEVFKVGDFVNKMMGVMVIDKSDVYKGFKDVNEWWISNKTPKHAGYFK
jgi:hypothetical protein